MQYAIVADFQLLMVLRCSLLYCLSKKWVECVCIAERGNGMDDMRHVYAVARWMVGWMDERMDG